MRLHELYIMDYKVLQELTLRFDEESAVAALIGENGSGKTTVVECITLIFSELFRQKTVGDLFDKVMLSFGFRIAYRLFRASPFDKSFSNDFGGGYFDVSIEGDKDKSLTHVSIKADDGTVYETPERISEFLQNEGQSISPVHYLFPSNVVIYYSGISTVLQQILEDYQQKIIIGTLQGEMQANQDLFYFKPSNFPALLIGLLSFRYGDIPNKLESGFQITQAKPFEQIVIKLRKPEWAKSRIRAENFWGATGDLANFLAVMRDKTSAVFTQDIITFTIVSTDQLDEVWGFYGEEKRLFEYLVTLQANGLIESIEVDLRKEQDLIVPYQRLSEGEKQLLIIMALRELLAADENSLFLLDEPDTYLHPEWKRNFIADFLPQKTQTDQFLAYYLITTHSPGIISGMHQKQLHILRKQDGRSVPKLFSFNPYGKPEDQILIEVFGLDGLRYKPVQEDLEKLTHLINNDDYDSEEFEHKFNALESKVGKGDEGVMRLKLEIARRKRAAK